MDRDDTKIFQAAVRAGMSPARAARYVRHVHRCQRVGREPLTPEQAAEAPRTRK